MGVSVNDPAPLAWVAGIVTSNDEGSAVNPTTLDPPDPATLTTTVCAVPKRAVPGSVALTVTVVAPASSVSVIGLRLSDSADGVPSSSVTVIVAGFTVTPPSMPLKVTVALLWSTLSFVGATVTVWLADLAPAGIVIVNWGMLPTPTPPAVFAPLTVTVLATPKVLAPCTVARTVTVRAAPVADSGIEAGVTESETAVGVGSSSATESAPACTVTPELAPLNVIVPSLSSTRLLRGVTVMVWLADGAPAGIVIVNGLIGSTSSWPAVRAALTATTRAAPNVVPPCTVAVTVTAVSPSPSTTICGLALRTIAVGVASSSVIVIVVDWIAPRL